VTATGQDDAAWMLACAGTRDAMRRGRRHVPRQVELLAAVGGADLAAAAGLQLAAAARRTPVVLDGPATAAAALVAARLSFRAPDWWLAGTLSPDPAHRLALTRVSLEPVLDLGLRGEDGTVALLAVPVLRAAVAG
jgi:nicotinate-nucleotide--dimethylbenzimidazole phosphoribosyltransferase